MQWRSPPLLVEHKLVMPPSMPWQGMLILSIVPRGMVWRPQRHMPHFTWITTSTILGLITIHTWAHVNLTLLRMLWNHPEIHSNRRRLSRISFASDYRRRWSWILPPAWWMMPMPGSIHPECNDFSSSTTWFAIDVANKASQGGGQGKTLTLSLCWLSSHKKDHP
jgi:hypothetical protein